MHASTLFAIILESPIDSDIGGALFTLSGLLLYLFLGVGAWWSNKDNSKTNEADAAKNEQDSSDTEKSDPTLPEGVPKPKARSRRWKSAPEEENLDSLSAEELDILAIERKKVTRLTKRLQKAEAELRSLKQDADPSKSGAKNRQLLLEKHKAIAERNKAQEKLRRYRERVAELEKMIPDQQASAGSTEVAEEKVEITQEKEFRLTATGQSELALQQKLSLSEAENEKLGRLLKETRQIARQAEQDSLKTKQRYAALEQKFDEARNDADELCGKLTSCRIN